MSVRLLLTAACAVVLAGCGGGMPNTRVEAEEMTGQDAEELFVRLIHSGEEVPAWVKAVDEQVLIASGHLVCQKQFEGYTGEALNEWWWETFGSVDEDGEMYLSVKIGGWLSLCPEHRPEKYDEE